MTLVQLLSETATCLWSWGWRSQTQRTTLWEKRKEERSLVCRQPTIISDAKITCRCSNSARLDKSGTLRAKRAQSWSVWEEDSLPSRHWPLNKTFCSRRNFSSFSDEEKFSSRETALHFKIFLGTRAGSRRTREEMAVTSAAFTGNAHKSCEGIKLTLHWPYCIHDFIVGDMIKGFL